MNDLEFSVDDMEGMIGGSTLDELRDLMGIESLEDGDIIFSLIEDSSIDLTKELYLIESLYGIKPGFTFIARCMKHDTKDYKYVVSDWQPDEEHTYYDWIEYS